MSHAVPWSFSKLKTYENCAARYRYKYVDKLPDSPPGPAAQRGIDKHNEIEQYIKGYQSWEVPPGPEALYPTLDKMRFALDGWRAAEFKVGYDSEWYAAGYKSPNTWVRGVLDAVWHDRKTDVIEIYEWKTGKPSDEHAEQRQLYAMFGLLWWKGVPEVSVTTVYLDETGPNKRLKMKDTALPRLQEEWNKRVVRMEKDEHFAPNPSWKCRWCSYSRDNGGPCKVA